MITSFNEILGSGPADYSLIIDEPAARAQLAALPLDTYGERLLVIGVDGLDSGLVEAFEPRGALVAGPRGTEVIERLIPQAAECLRGGGHLLMEIGPAIHDAVCSLLNGDGRFELGQTIKDLARLPRVVQAKKR